MIEKNLEKKAIYIIDDDQSILDSLTWMLDPCGYECITFNSPIAFLDNIDIHQQGVVVLDIAMPLMSGLELQQYLYENNSSLAVIILTGHGTINMAVQAMKNGVVSFLEKPVDGGCLLDLISQAFKTTEKRYNQNIINNQIEQRLASLTDREKQIMEKILEGKLNKVVASELEISIRTVEIHRHNVLNKMQANNLADLAFSISKLNNK